MSFTPQERSLFNGTYDTKNPSHRQLILDKTRTFEKTYAALSATDQWVLGGGFLAIIGGVPLIPFTWIIAVSGGALAAWNAKGRGDLSIAYQEALNDAVKVFEWGFEGTDVSQVLRYKELQDLTLALAPLLSTKEWTKWERQKLLELASDEKIGDKVSREVAHAARQGVKSLWDMGWSAIGFNTKEEEEATPISDEPSSKEENAVFIAKIDGFAKGSTLGSVTYKVYGYNQSLNPLAMFSLTSQVKDEIVKKGMEVVVNATTAKP